MKYAFFNFLLLLCWITPGRFQTTEITTGCISTTEKNESPADLIEDLDDNYLSNFDRILVEFNDLFVDKTAFIVHVTNRTGITDSILRGRRWGKTFNLKMLQTFFDIRYDQNGIVIPWNQRDIYFKGGKLRRTINSEKNTSEIITLNPLEVSKHPHVMDHMGRHPVLYLSFLDCGTTYDIFSNCVIKKLAAIIKAKNYAYFLTHHCNFITYQVEGIYGDRAQCKQLLRNPKEALKSKFLLERSLSILAALLNEHFHQPPVVLIDEYDFPLHDMIYSKVDFDKTSQFLHNLFYYTFPIERQLLFKGIVAGLLRVHVTETLFVNIIGGGTFLDREFSSDFGFTKQEVGSLLQKHTGNLTMNIIDQWYDGFYSHDRKMYNPHSVINCFLRGGTYRTFWIDDGSSTKNEKLDHELKISSSLMLVDKHQTKLQKLYCGYKITTGIAISTDFRNPMGNEELLSNFIFLGYSSAYPIRPTKLNNKDYYKPYPNKYEVSIPNKEIRDFFRTNMKTWAVAYKLHLQEEGRLCQDFDIKSQQYEKQNLADVKNLISNDIFPKISTFEANHCDGIFALMLTLEGPWILNRTFTQPGTEFLDCIITLSPSKSNKLDPLFVAVKYTNEIRHKMERKSWKKKFIQNVIPGLIHAIPLIKNMRYGFPKEMAPFHLDVLLTHISEPFIYHPDALKSILLHSSPKSEMTELRRVLVEVYRVYRPEEGRQTKPKSKLRKALGKIWPFRSRPKTTTRQFTRSSSSDKSDSSSLTKDESDSIQGKFSSFNEDEEKSEYLNGV